MIDNKVETKHCPVCDADYPEGDVCPVDGATLIAKWSGDALVGQVLKGTYRICGKVGEGGMGHVYRAVQLPIERVVAVKAIFTHNPSLAPEQVQRFLREARLLSQVNHPNVVHLIDFGNTENGVFYMVMEHLTGRTLESVVGRNKGLPVSAALEIMEQICGGVEAAHAHQIVHRDLKPANIFLHTVGPQAFLVKILDFGIARPLDDALDPLTQTGVMLGSCGYMAPEQITGNGEVDARADIYALGAILYFLLSGEQAYSGKTTRLVLAKQMSQLPDPIDFEALGKRDAADLMPVILKAMDLDPAYRFQTVGEFLEAIEDALPRNGAKGGRRPTGIVIPSTSATGTTVVRAKTPAIGRPAPRPTRSRPTTARPTPAPPTKAPKPAVEEEIVAQAPKETADSAERRIPMPVVALVAVALLVIVSTGWFFLGRNQGAVSGTEKGKPGLAVQGVTDNEIRFGMSAPFSGPAKELGRQMKVGVETYFDSVNDQGGIHGRKLKLISLDDGYTPDRALANVEELNSQHKVFGLIGNVGTPTALKALPYAMDHKMLFFGPFTGAESGNLRASPPARYVFHYRASYAEETAWMVEHLVKMKHIKPEEIAVFAQKDGYGDAGFQGVARAFRKSYGRDQEQILRVGYERNTDDVTEAVEQILRHKELKAVIMVPTYKAAANFIKKLRDANSTLTFASVSFVGSDALANELKPDRKYGEGVIVTQVVPHPDSSASAIINYRELLKKYHPEEAPSSVSLEGFVDAILLAKALERTGPELSTDRLISALESIQDLDLGLGTTLGFKPSDHQASHKVWGTVLDGSFIYQRIDDE